jgi:hypothetical protein
VGDPVRQGLSDLFLFVGRQHRWFHEK